LSGSNTTDGDAAVSTIIEIRRMARCDNNYSGVILITKR